MKKIPVDSVTVQYASSAFVLGWLANRGGMLSVARVVMKLFLLLVGVCRVFVNFCLLYGVSWWKVQM